MCVNSIDGSFFGIEINVELKEAILKVWVHDELDSYEYKQLIKLDFSLKFKFDLSFSCKSKILNICLDKNAILFYKYDSSDNQLKFQNKIRMNNQIPSKI